MGVAIIATLLISQFWLKQALASECKDVSIVFARGSGQNVPTGQIPFGSIIDWGKDANGYVRFDRDSVFRDTEKESAKYFSEIGNRILKEYPTLDMQFVSLHDFAGKYNQYGYRAVEAFGTLSGGLLTRNAVDAKFGYSAVIGESSYGEYRQSVQDGAEELAGYLADEMTRCPSQYNVLGGYSQGAQVVGEAMAMMHSRGQDNLLSRLGHVDLFGDPKFNGFKLSTSRFNPLQKHTTYPWVRGSANENEVGSLGPRDPYIPDIITAQTTSWCDFNDLVCGGYAGLSVSDFLAHSHVYSDKGGWIEKSANETYIDMKQRLSLLAGVEDKSANSPLAYWPGISEPSKLDIMFVMDSTADESLSLVPDPDYLANNFTYLSSPNAPNHDPSDDYYSSIHAGVATFTEFQEGDDIVSYPKVPVPITEDVYSEFGAFRSTWGAAHFLGNNVGGVDVQDSPFGAIDLALDQSWRDDARKVIVLFSNSYGKDTEPVSGLTMKKITAKAREKNVEILPVFTSRTFRANESRVQLVPAANAFYAAMAKQSSGHAAEVTDGISATLVYDVIMGHVFAPDVKITKGKTYTDSKTKKTASKDIDEKTVFKKGEKIVLSASDSNSPESTIVHYAWDFDGDGIIDYESDQPYGEHTYDNNYQGGVCVTVTDTMGVSTTGCTQISVSDDDSDVTDDDPIVINAPNFHANRNGSDLVITWPPVEGYIILREADGTIIEYVNGMSGIFTIHDVPTGEFDIYAQLVQGDNQSDEVRLRISAIQFVTTTSDNIPTNTGTTNNNTGTTQTGGTTAPVSNTHQVLTTQQVMGSSTGGGPILVTNSKIAGEADLRVPEGGVAGLARVSKGGTGKAGKSFLARVKNGIGRRLQGVSGVFDDFILWLILVFLLMAWLYFKSRQRDEDNYQHDVQKRFASRKVVSLGVQAAAAQLAISSANSRPVSIENSEIVTTWRAEPPICMWPE